MRMETPNEKAARETALRHACADRMATIRRIQRQETLISDENDRLQELYAELEQDHASVSRYTRTQ